MRYSYFLIYPLALIVFLLPHIAQAQFQEWQTHTSLREVIDVTSSEDAIWVATTGGVFRYVVNSGEISRFTTTEGLYGLNIKGVQYDAFNQTVWVGYGDGALDRIDPADNTIKLFLDITRASLPEREIRRLAITNDTLIVATGFGVVLFNTSRGEVIETYSRFGSTISAGPTSDIAITTVPDGTRRIWLTISSDEENVVVSAPLSGANLQDPSEWTIETVGNGQLPLTSIAGFQNNLFVGTTNGLFIRDDADQYRLLDVSSGEIKSLIPTADRLIGMEANKLSVYESSGIARTVGSGGLRDLAALVEGPDGNLWAGDFIEGLSAFDPLSSATSAISFSRESFFPTGPFDGQFSELTFDRDGNLWLGGIRGPTKGFYKLDTEGTWTSYTNRFFEELVGQPTRFEFIHGDSQGNIWVGSFGGGLVQINQNAAFNFFTPANSSLQEALAEPGTGFTIVKGIDSEPDGTLWVANTGSARPLHVRLLDGSWAGFPSAAGVGLTYEQLFVDSFRQKWIVTLTINNLERRAGLLVLDTGSDVTDPSDDFSRYFSETGSNGQGLPSTVVNSIAEDKSGRIWLGTDLGLAYFVNTGIIAQDQNAVPFWPLRSSRQEGESQFLFFGLKINAVAVDPANNLWVGTDIGAFYVQEADLGFESVTQLTAENSPLLSNVILNIAIDERTGEIYFSTDVGLISLRGDAIAPNTEAEDLFVYPNPVRLDEQADPQIFIEGLLDETDVRILTAAGTLVTSISARGGRVRWDGRDRNNQLVPSGMYIIVALDENGSGSSYGKIAVIR